MKSKNNKHLLIMGAFAFIGVILFVATVVLTCTALFTWLEASGGSPRLNVWEIGGGTAAGKCIDHPPDRERL